jgi:hypothetical protein
MEMMENHPENQRKSNPMTAIAVLCGPGKFLNFCTREKLFIDSLRD